MFVSAGLKIDLSKTSLVSSEIIHLGSQNAG